MSGPFRAIGHFQATATIFGVKFGQFYVKMAQSDRYWMSKWPITWRILYIKDRYLQLSSGPPGHMVYCEPWRILRTDVYNML